MKTTNVFQYFFAKSKIFSAQCMFALLSFLPALAFADDADPMTKAGHKFYVILFGTLGGSLCAIIIGATFLLAKVGKVSWDQFMFIGFCSAGFLGTPSIITLLKSIVGQG